MHKNRKPITICLFIIVILAGLTIAASAQTEDLCPFDPNKTEPGVCGCGVADTDTDGDGTPDCEDLCPVHSFKVEPGLCGCGIPDADSDGDGIPNCHDWRPYDPDNTWPGYWSPDRDADGDGTVDCEDGCPYDPDKTSPGLCGCYNPDTDTNGDGMPDCVDLCPLDLDSNAPTVCGCGVGAWNRDIWPTKYGGNDMIPDCVDGCPMDYYKYDPGLCGCFISDVADTDGDGTPDCKDECPGDPTSTTPPCKCGDEAAADSDGDGTPDCADLCPSNQDKIFGGMCGCNSDDIDTDGDGVPDCLDQCDYNPVLRWAGLCGCDVEDYDENGVPLDIDRDGHIDCLEACPDDPNKSEPGVCGCGVADIDTDHDGTYDCHDQCPEDFYKEEPGICGCGIPDTDSDGDGTADCNDLCPYDINKTEPGICGCGVEDSDTDTDGDGVPDCIDQCPGIDDTIDTDGDGVGDCIDGCPTDPNKTEIGQCGCFNPDIDTDGDGTADCIDGCPVNPYRVDYDYGLCASGPEDCNYLLIRCDSPFRQGCNRVCYDGVCYPVDSSVCNYVGSDGYLIDTDGDGLPDYFDGCPEDPLKTEPGICGCGNPETDRDGDGYPWCVDECDENPDMIKRAEICGCAGPDIDTDGDGWLDCMDACPEDPNKYEAPGICGCGVPDTDTDGDGTADCNDACPHDSTKINDVDTDADGVLDCNDQCPGEPDTDSDGDGVANCRDECPLDPSKFEGYVEFDHCDCGVPDIDTDGDGWLDCFDLCPFNTQWGHTESNCYGGTGQECKFYEIITGKYVTCVPACPYILDHGGCDDGDPETYDYCDPDVGGCRHIPDACPDDPDKATPGVCGCGVPDTDSDGDGTADCNEPCPGGASVETCNGLDDDCNGLTDEKIITYMNSVTAYSDGSSLTMMLPTAQAGDFLIAQVTFRNDIAIGTIPTPDGWSAFPRVNNDADRFGQIIYYRAVAADATDQEFTFTFPEELHSAGGIIRYTGVGGISSYSSYVGSDEYIFQLPDVSAEPGSRLVVFLNKLGDDCIGWPVSLNSTRFLALMNDVYTRNNPGNLTIRAADERVSGTSTDTKYLFTWSDSPWIMESVVLDPGSVCAGDTEVCDGIDNDGDGLIDEGNPGGGVACETGQPGVCSGGITNCSGGELICEQTTTSSEEVCDGLDNDCDGSVDEDLTRGTTCGVGACSAAGHETCAAGVWGSDTCLAGIPVTETCNNVDDDCDGLVDEDLTRGTTCGVGACSAAGYETCVAGVWGSDTCVAGTPGTETCNNLDDDCDGLIDEVLTRGTTCGIGACSAAGYETCVAGVWGSDTCLAGTPVTETCNNIDDDCDGLVDEDLTRGTTCGIGACSAAGYETCAAGVWGSDTCLAGTPGTELCGDGIDNDCDGSIDEGFNVGEACSVGVGACAAGGQYVCSVDKVSTVCDAVAGTPSPELCDGIDNDCDGSIADDGADETWYHETTSCGIGVCAADGQYECSGGIQTDTCVEGIPGPETTNPFDGLDNNCDGIIDNGLDAMMTIINGSQIVQYSDGIDTITLTATNIPADFVDAILKMEWNVNSGAFTSNPPMNLVIEPDDLDPEVIDTGATCVENETNPLYWDCSWNISGSMGVPAGIYTLKATLSESDGGTPNTAATITVLPENASCKFDDGNPVSVRVESDGEDSGDFYLVVDVKEKQPDLPADYNLPGDIGLAQVDMSLVHVGSGGSIPADECTNVTDPDGYNAVKIFECTFDNVPVDAYTIAVTIDGDSYYTGSCEDVLVVYDPSLGCTTGGGSFLWDGDKTNFGYTMKYNKKATNIQGNLLLIRHHLEDDTEALYRVKSNALYGLALGEDTSVPMGWASFSGKSTYLEPGMSEAEGNYEFVVYVEDRDEPGTGADRFWIQVYGGESMSMPAEVYAIEIIGGNIVVPHKASSDGGSAK